MTGTAYDERRNLASRRTHYLAVGCRRASTMTQEASGNTCAYLSFIAQDMDDLTNALNGHRIHDWDVRTVIIKTNETRRRLVEALLDLGHPKAATEVQSAMRRND